MFIEMSNYINNNNINIHKMKTTVLFAIEDFSRFDFFFLDFF